MAFSNVERVGTLSPEYSTYNGMRHPNVSWEKSSKAFIHTNPIEKLLDLI